MEYSPSSRTHKKYSPSKAERVSQCPGSAEMCERAGPLPSTSYAEEGTYADQVLMHAIDNGTWNARKSELYIETPTWFEADKEWDTQFFYSIQFALDYVKDIVDENPGCVVYTQRFVDPPSKVAPGDTGGHLDIAIWCPLTRTLYIIDYKHGAGVTKEVIDNEQVLQYASGFLFGGDFDWRQVHTVNLVIVQPRAFHKNGPIREWPIVPYQAYEFSMNYDDVILEAQKDNALLRAGPWCQFCDAKFACPERERSHVSKIDASFKAVSQISDATIPKVDELELSRLAYIRAHASDIRSFLSDVERRCEELAKRGVAIPGAKLVAPHGRRKYYFDDEEVLERLEMLTDLPRNELCQLRVVPLTHAEKLVVAAYQKHKKGRKARAKAAEEAKEAFAMLTLKQAYGAPQLVDLNDPRPALNRAQAFEQLKTIEPPPKRT